MRAFITGISGFVGLHLARYLAKEGLEVYGIAEGESSNPFLGLDLVGRVFFYVCDIRDSERLGQILRDVEPDQIFHLAGVGFLPEAEIEVQRTFQINLLGTLSLYEAVRRVGARAKILFVGSAQEYGLSFNDGPVTEEYHLMPIDPYSASKASADLLSFQYCYGFGLPIIRVRPFNHTGPGQSDRFVCSNFAKQIVEIELGEREPILYVGNLEARRDFLDVRDVAHAYRLALQEGKVGEVYNICSGRSVTIREVLNLLLSYTGKTIRVVEDPARRRDLEIAAMVGECEKFKVISGWRNTIPLEQTLMDLLYYWRRTLTSSSGCL